MERSMSDYIPDRISSFFTNLAEKFKMSQDIFLQYGIAAGIGFLVGFLIKKFSSYVAVVIAACLAITVLCHFGIMNVVIDWQRMQSMLGLEGVGIMDQNIFELLLQYIRLNIAMTLCALIGFFIGLKLG